MQLAKYIKGREILGSYCARLPRVSDYIAHVTKKSMLRGEDLGKISIC